MTTPSHASALANALNALSAGQSHIAEPLLHQVLRQWPDSHQAMAALGQVAAQRRQWEASHEWFERSLKAVPSQARVWFACGQVREALERPADAARAFEAAVELEPRWPLARYHRARLLRECGNQADAMNEATIAVQLAPSDVNALQLLAMLQEECNQLPAAEATLQAALRHEPARASLHHNLGVVLYRSGRHAASLAAHEQAQALGLNVAEAHYNHGNTLQALGHAEAALAAYRRALALTPLHALSLYDLARLRWVLGHPDFDAELRAAEQAWPESHVPVGLRGLLLLRAERAQEAELAYRRALVLMPQTAAYADGLGQALGLQGRHEEACTAHERAVSLVPRDLAVLVNAARAMYAAGLVTEGLALADRAHALAPHDQHAIALQGLGWRLTGDTRDGWLHDIGRVTGAIDLAPPPGWADMESFNAALADELARLHTDARAPIDQTLRQGTQTRGNLFDLDLPLVNALRRQIEAAVGAWLAERPADDLQHPLLGRNTGRWRFSNSWSSRLSSTGFHTNHVHGHGWLSSCYYVRTPASALASPTHAGWIKFGEPDLPLPIRASLPPVHFEAPKPGRLLLFPSYFWHGTVPFKDEGYRLTVAFDVVPA